MEHDRALQRVPHVCIFCGANQQQPTHLHVDGAQSRCDGTSMGWHAGFIPVWAQIPEGC